MLEARPLGAALQKRTKIITASIVAGGLVLGATVAIAAPIVYRDPIVGEAESAPSVTFAPTATAEPGTAAPDLSGTWAVVDGSFAGYRVEAPNLGFVSVEPDGVIEFSLVLARG
ncbi:hypothetical protein ASE14_11055 [Agromyces sp. Root81]|uniref:hypothetical protein n=1 Tax=Agromyces sp. Root81 TaxID=1736601 RepID=UPI0006F9FCF2|nr:hypothetical protein [Agromyces sp. Root81]KRC61408.1 hypothetical protein ASE14_11055 [Agromyces sp. Root81]